MLRAAHGHRQLKIVIPILIHFTFGSSLLNTESHCALGSPRASAQAGRQLRAQFKNCRPQVASKCTGYPKAWGGGTQCVGIRSVRIGHLSWNSYRKRARTEHLCGQRSGRSRGLQRGFATEATARVGGEGGLQRGWQWGWQRGVPPPPDPCPAPLRPCAAGAVSAAAGAVSTRRGRCWSGPGLRAAAAAKPRGRAPGQG